VRARVLRTRRSGLRPCSGPSPGTAFSSPFATPSHGGGDITAWGQLLSAREDRAAQPPATSPSDFPWPRVARYLRRPDFRGRERRRGRHLPSRGTHRRGVGDARYPPGRRTTTHALRTRDPAERLAALVGPTRRGSRPSRGANGCRPGPDVRATRGSRAPRLRYGRYKQAGSAAYSDQPRSILGVRDHGDSGPRRQRCPAMDLTVPRACKWRTLGHRFIRNRRVRAHARARRRVGTRGGGKTTASKVQCGAGNSRR